MPSLLKRHSMSPGSLQVSLEVEEEAHPQIAKEAPQDASAIQVSLGSPARRERLTAVVGNRFGCLSVDWVEISDD